MVFIRKPDPRADFGSPTPTAATAPDRGAALPTSSFAQPAPPASDSMSRTMSAQVPGAESVIGSDLSIEGQSLTIRCKGSLRINGTIQADLHSHQLTVGQDAQIMGSIAADTVDVYGRVSGAILGARVILHRSAQVEGDIHSKSLTIEDGAAFDGRSRKVTDDQAIAPQLEAAGAAPRTEPHPGILTPPRLHS
jgi:cytoskeletal protein CcmA (bactofilin family)